MQLLLRYKQNKSMDQKNVRENDNTTSKPSRSSRDPNRPKRKYEKRPKEPVHNYPVPPTTIQLVMKSGKCENHSYSDFSKVPPESGFAFPTRIQDMPFALRLHKLLSDEHSSDSITWLPHGRAFIILQPKKLEDQVLPYYLGHSRYSKLLTQIREAGFKELTKGTDRGAYYHECFLQNRPHLCRYMPINKVARRPPPDPEHEPDLYAIGRKFPLHIEVPATSANAGTSSSSSPLVPPPTSALPTTITLGPQQQQDRKAPPPPPTSAILQALQQQQKTAPGGLTRGNSGGSHHSAAAAAPMAANSTGLTGAIPMASRLHHPPAPPVGFLQSSLAPLREPPASTASQSRPSTELALLCNLAAENKLLAAAAVSQGTNSNNAAAVRLGLSSSSTTSAFPQLGGGTTLPNNGATSSDSSSTTTAHEALLTSQLLQSQRRCDELLLRQQQQQVQLQSLLRASPAQSTLLSSTDRELLNRLLSSSRGTTGNSTSADAEYEALLRRLYRR